MTPARLVTLFSSSQRVPAELSSLFNNGQVGDIWIPHFTKYAFQDAAMTIPAVVGMPVVKMVGLVRGVVATFANVTLQQDANGKKHLLANGTSSYGQTTAINLTGVDEAMVMAGFHKASDATTGVVMELSANAGTNAGSCVMLVPAGATSVSFDVRGTSSVFTTSAAYAAPVTVVATGQMDISADQTTLRVNGAQKELDTADLGTGNLGNHVLNFFARNAGSLWLNGRFYGGLIVGATPTAGQIVDAERALNRYTSAAF